MFQNTRDWSLYILDCAFSVGVVGSLVVFVWRGVWVLFEIHLFPENQEYSAIGSLVSTKSAHPVEYEKYKKYIVKLKMFRFLLLKDSVQINEFYNERYIAD